MVLVGTIIGILPGLAWLYFTLQEDLHPEPKKLIAFTFAVGILSAFVALFAQVAIDAYLHNAQPADALPYAYRSSLIVIIAFALIEELAKFGAAYFAIHKNPAFDEPVDAMIYMIAASLGFATIENVGFVLQGVTQEASGALSSASILSGIFELSSIRFIGATLLHTVTAGIVGYFWAWDVREFNRTRFLLVGLSLATALHTGFNYLIMNARGQDAIFYTTLLLMIAAFFVLYDFEKLKRKVV